MYYLGIFYQNCSLCTKLANYLYSNSNSLYGLPSISNLFKQEIFFKWRNNSLYLDSPTVICYNLYTKSNDEFLEPAD